MDDDILTDGGGRRVRFLSQGRRMRLRVRVSPFLIE